MFYFLLIMVFYLLFPWFVLEFSRISSSGNCLKFPESNIHERFEFSSGKFPGLRALEIRSPSSKKWNWWLTHTNFWLCSASLRREANMLNGTFFREAERHEKKVEDRGWPPRTNDYVPPPFAGKRFTQTGRSARNLKSRKWLSNNELPKRVFNWY